MLIKFVSHGFFVLWFQSSIPIYKIGYIICIILFIFAEGVKAETINFNDILNKALQSAHEINIAKADEQISYANKE
jgi:hypothetical protein